MPPCRLRVSPPFVPGRVDCDATFVHSHNLYFSPIRAERTWKSDKSELRWIQWTDPAPALHESRLLQIPSVPPKCAEPFRELPAATLSCGASLIAGRLLSAGQILIAE